MSELTNQEINKKLGAIFQKYRLKNNLTQEQLSEIFDKSPKTISRIETGKDGTSKKTDINLMNYLEIMPNILYKDFITNENLIQKIKLFEKIDILTPEQIEAITKIIDTIKTL